MNPLLRKTLIVATTVGTIMPAYRHNAFAATPLTKTAKTAETALTESGNTGKYVQLKSLREPRKQRIPMMQASTVQT